MKLFCRRYGIVLFITALLLTAFLALRAFLSPTIYRTHTTFLFSQLEQAYRDSLSSGHQAATTSQEFTARIPQWTIDWNSCRFHDRTIYDSWGTPAEVHFGPSQIELRSAGPDRIFNSSDDISHQIPN